MFMSDMSNILYYVTYFLTKFQQQATVMMPNYH